MNSQNIADYRGTGVPPVKCGLGNCCAVTLAALAMLGPAATAQEASPPPAPAPPAVQIQVHQPQSLAEVITVAVNQGALVDFSVPVKEVRVANPEIADVTATTPRQILVNGKTFGTTQLVVQTDGGSQQVFTIAVDLDLKRLEASIRSLVPRAQVKVAGLLDAIVVSGTVPDAESADRVMQIAGIYSPQVINQMHVAGVYQVLLRCTVAEVNRTATRQLGFNGWMAGDNFKDMFAVSQLGGINPVNIGAAANANVTAAIPFVTDKNGLPLSTTPTLSLGFPRVETTTRSTSVYRRLSTSRRATRWPR